MQHNLLSASDLDKQDILDIFRRVDELRKQQPNKRADTTKVGALLFFENSTRTRVGFEVAAWKLGLKSVLLQETKHNASMSAAESMADTIRTLNPYVSFFCIRHPDEDIFSEVLPFTTHPVINCGNGYNEHPTQAITDAYTMWSKFGSLDGLNITLVGELKYDRAAHSLLLLLSQFSNITINEFTPSELRLQNVYKNGVRADAYNRWPKPDWGKEQVVYVTGFAPKNPSGTFSQNIRDTYKISRETVTKLASDCIILDALPRIDEIDSDVDDMPNAYYFKQNEFGLYVRVAILERFCL